MQAHMHTWNLSQPHGPPPKFAKIICSFHRERKFATGDKTFLEKPFRPAIRCAAPVKKKLGVIKSTSFLKKRGVCQPFGATNQRDKNTFEGYSPFTGMSKLFSSNSIRDPSRTPFPSFLHASTWHRYNPSSASHGLIETIPIQANELQFVFPTNHLILSPSNFP